MVDLADDLFQRALGGREVVELRPQRAGPRLQLREFLQRVEVHAAQLAELLAQLGHFFFGSRQLIFCNRPYQDRLTVRVDDFQLLPLSSGLEGNLVILAQPGHQGVAAVAQVIDLQVAGMRLLLLRPPFAAHRLGLAGQAQPLLAVLLPFGGQLGHLDLGSLLDVEPLRQARRGVEHRQLVISQPRFAIVQGLLALGTLLAALLQVGRHLVVLRPQAGQASLDLGEGHGGVRRLPLPLLALHFALADFDLRPLDAFLQGANLVFCRRRLRFGLPVRHVERVDLAGDAADLIAAE